MLKVILFNSIGSVMCLFVTLVTAFLFFNIPKIDFKMTVWLVFIAVFTILMICNSIKNIKKDLGIKLKKDRNYTFGVVLSILIFFIVILGSGLYDIIDMKKNGVKTYATIYDVDKKITYRTDYDEEGNEYEVKEESCTFSVSYYVNNKEYTNKLSLFCNKKIGDEVEIYYDKNNPSKIVKDDTLLLVICIVIITAILIWVIINAIKTHPSNQKNKSKKVIKNKTKTNVSKKKTK